MGLLGMLIGSYLGGTIGHLPGSLIGAFLGHKAEIFLRGKKRRFTKTSRSAKTFPLMSAYATIGALPTDDAKTLKRKYHTLAKKNHPDTLRSQGLSEEMIVQATERMSRINAAWSTIREYRNI